MHIDGNKTPMAEVDIRGIIHIWVLNYYTSEKNVEIGGTSLNFVVVTIIALEGDISHFHLFL